MTSPYLDRPLLPLAVALPQMLEEIEADLAHRRTHRDAASPPAGRVDPQAARTAGAIAHPVVT